MMCSVLSVLVIFILLIQGFRAQLKARVVNGTASWNGRLEIFYNETWGTVCGSSFGKKEAIVACRMLGFNTSQALAVSSFFYGEGSGPVVFDEMLCTGDESSLDQCQHGGFYKNRCRHLDDVGVVCYTQPVQLRLMDTHGIRRDRGRVEMEVGGQWSSLCMSHYTVKVVCRQLGFSYSAVFKNASILMEGSFGLKFICLGNETNLFNCEQQAWYRFCRRDYNIICGDSPYLRILYEKHLNPPLEGTKITLECDSPQSGQSNVNYWWSKDSSKSGKYLTFDKMTRQHQGFHVRCMAEYIYDGLEYLVFSDNLVMKVCCAPTINSTNGPPPALSSGNDEGHLSIEMTAYPIPYLKNITYLGPVLNESIEGKKIGNLYHVDCVASLESTALVTCSITVFNISKAAEGFYKIFFRNSLGVVPFIFIVNRNVDHTRETSQTGETSHTGESSTGYFLVIGGCSTGGVVLLTAAAIFLLCRWRRLQDICGELVKC